VNPYKEVPKSKENEKIKKGFFIRLGRFLAPLLQPFGAAFFYILF